MKKIKPITQLMKCMRFKFRFHPSEEMSVALMPNEEKIEGSELAHFTALSEYLGDDLELAQEDVRVNECKLFELLGVSVREFNLLANTLHLYDNCLSEAAFGCDEKSDARNAARRVEEKRKEIIKIIKGFKIGVCDFEFDTLYSDILEREI